jgi:hypothetical protein
MKKENTRVIKCFSGYKEQFYTMKNKFIELSDFIRDVRFKANIKEELNRRDFMNFAKKLGNFKNQKTMGINNESNSIENNANKRRRGSAFNFNCKTNINDIFVKDINSDDYKLNFHFSEKELNGKLLKKEETAYEQFLKSYQKIESEKKEININNENNIENNKENNHELNNKNNHEIINGNKNVSNYENNDDNDKNILKKVKEIIRDIIVIVIIAIDIIIVIKKAIIMDIMAIIIITKKINIKKEKKKKEKKMKPFLYMIDMEILFEEEKIKFQLFLCQINN